MIDTQQRQTVAGCGRSWGIGGGKGRGELGRVGVGKEVLIYSGRTGAGGETLDVVLGVCVCAGVCSGGWMMVVLRGFSWGGICDPVLSARSVVKAFRIKPPPPKLL